MAGPVKSSLGLVLILQTSHNHCYTTRLALPELLEVKPRLHRRNCQIVAAVVTMTTRKRIHPYTTQNSVDDGLQAALYTGPSFAVQHGDTENSQNTH